MRSLRSRSMPSREGEPMFGRRRKDEAAWRTVQLHLAPCWGRSPLYRDWERGTLAGVVEQVYLDGRRGTKVIVDFGQAGRWDTWWPNARPTAGSWVVVDCHLWRPPGTHSSRSVLWVDHWRGQWAGDIHRRARRHELRQARRSPVETADGLFVESSRASHAMSPVTSGRIRP
jgi:hypothetical protein